MIEKEKLKEYAKKLMFEMNDEEYETLQKEFDIILQQIAVLDDIKGIKDVLPMTFPYITFKAKLREDEIEESLSIEDVLKNASSTYLNQIKVPKVVD